MLALVKATNLIMQCRNTVNFLVRHLFFSLLLPTIFFLSFFLSLSQLFSIPLFLSPSSAPRSRSCSPSPDSYSLYCYPCTWGSDCVTPVTSGSSEPPSNPPLSSATSSVSSPAQASWSHPRATFCPISAPSAPLLSADSSHKSYSSCSRPRPVSQSRFAPFGALNPFANPGHGPASTSASSSPAEWLTATRTPSPGPSLLASDVTSPALSVEPEEPCAVDLGSVLSSTPTPSPRRIRCPGVATDNLSASPSPTPTPAPLADPIRGAEGGASGVTGGQPDEWRPPSELCALSVEEVSSCLRFIGLSEEVVSLFSRERIDGSIFTQLSEEILADDFSLTKLQVKKIMQFIKGWRPKI